MTTVAGAVMLLGGGAILRLYSPRREPIEGTILLVGVALAAIGSFLIGVSM